MPIEWLAVSAAVTPHLKQYLQGRAEKLAAAKADSTLASLYRRIVPDHRLLAANEAFLTRFSKELDYTTDLPTLTADSYQDALATY